MSLPKSYTSSIHGSDMPDDQLADYKTVFPTEVAKFPYDKHKVARVVKNRALFGGQLFFDKLCMENLDRVENIQDTYPPKATSFLRHFFEKILQSNIDRLRQHSFVYYLLRDFHEDRARKYAKKAMMPEHFCRLMDGMWFFDQLLFEQALPCITHPAVHFPYPDLVLSVLLSVPSFNTTSPSPYLALTFVECTQPCLLSDASIAIYFRALLSVSPAQAFLYTRVAQVHLRNQLLKMLVEHCLTVDREKNAMVLLELPMMKEEEVVVEEVLRKATGIMGGLARDTLLERWVNSGRMVEVLDMVRGEGVASEARAAGVNWADLRRGVEMGLGERRGLAAVRGN
ncbi:nuclear pore complex assembly-domain-containing protein [Tirmania nivea]|nr:nuclear pore complex assembly-domain-containing protein [Tirmania nivea]